MKNQEIAKILFDIAEMLELQNVAFKPRAYQRAARTIESLSEDIVDVWKRGDILELPGVGESIAEKIVEYITTGKIKYYAQLKKKLPMDVEQLGRVPGIGPKRMKLLYDKLKVKTLAELKKAAEAHKIQHITGLGEKVEQDILKGISFAQQNKGRALLGYVIPFVEELRRKLQLHPTVKKVEIAGSYRRKKETIGDIDVLMVSSAPEKVMDFFVHMDDVADVLAHGKTKSSVLLKSGIQVDARVVQEREFGSALQYFTGNKEHNVELRKLALKNGFTLSEYGLFTLKGKKWIAGRTEEEVYRKLGVDLMPPEMRENMGEISAGLRHTLPNVLDYGSCNGDFQMHTKWSDGQDKIEEMARAAQKLGRKFITITDHVGQVGITNPLNEKRLEQQAKEIKLVQKKVGIRIFHGAEVDILKDGKLALSTACQKKLDVVLASVHLATKMSSAEMTRRICTALEKNRVHILGHPTGRLLNQREGYAVDFGYLFDVARKTSTFLDIDCHPERMDLPSVHIKQAKDAGCKFAISTDSHSVAGLHNLYLGEALARRGWLEKKDVLNTFSVKEIEKMLAKK